MARKPRYYLAGFPCHVIQRGNNREPCFFADLDYVYYLDCLKDAASKYDCAVHAYVLMTNHVHLLMTPATPDGISRVMQSVGRRYVQYVNFSYKRTGTLWEGRHKASLIQTQTYLLSCYRYIELNPVRAGMVERPGDYPWSSYAAHAAGKPDPVVEDHAEHLALGDTADQRQRAYRELFRQSIPDADLSAIRRSVQLGVPWGNDRFRQAVEEKLCQRISYRPRGRPRKELDEGASK
jgi:putative transposase